MMGWFGCGIAMLKPRLVSCLIGAAEYGAKDEFLGIACDD